MSLSVVRESDGRSAEVDLSRIVSCHSLSPEDDLDVAVLALAGPPWDDDVKAPRFARVDRGLGAELVDCQAVGYPNFQRDPEARVRNPVELHGPIRRMEDRDSGYLILRDQILQGVGADPASPGRAVDDGAWGGLSGALVFFRGYALGHVVQHQPRRGGPRFASSRSTDYSDRQTRMPAGWPMPSGCPRPVRDCPGPSRHLNPAPRWWACWTSPSARNRDGPLPRACCGRGIAWSSSPARPAGPNLTGFCTGPIRPRRQGVLPSRSSRRRRAAARRDSPWRRAGNSTRRAGLPDSSPHRLGTSQASPDPRWPVS